MRIALGDPVSAFLLAPADPPPDIGARIEVPYTRAIAAFWVPALLVDTGDALRWEVEQVSPVVAGDYLLVWLSGVETPSPIEVFVPLFVG